MAYYILDKHFEPIYLIDDFKSMLWTERYNDLGEFELVTGFDQDLYSVATIGRYVENTESDRLMVITTRYPSIDSDGNITITYTGSSLEMMLQWRVIWMTITITNETIQQVIEDILIGSFINPFIPERRIENFVFKEVNDKDVHAVTLSGSYSPGQVVFDVISELCQTYGIGFKITLNQAQQFVFELYFGKDRSYKQGVNPHVVFSPKLDNIVTGDFYESDINYKNVGFIPVTGGEEDEVIDRVAVGSYSGLDRREVTIDPSDLALGIEYYDEISSVSGDYQYYLEELAKKGYDYLKTYKRERYYEGSIETTQGFEYGVDYFLGDIVQIENQLGNTSSARITEIVFSQDANGKTVVPTFESIPWEVDNK